MGRSWFGPPMAEFSYTISQAKYSSKELFLCTTKNHLRLFFASFYFVIRKFSTNTIVLNFNFKVSTLTLCVSKFQTYSPKPLSILCSPLEGEVLLVKQRRRLRGAGEDMSPLLLAKVNFIIRLNSKRKCY